MTIRFVAIAATLLIACSAAPALASPAVLYRDADVREGPGEQYSVLWNLVAGTHVDVRECRADEWCRVIRRDKEGWLKFEHLDVYPGVDTGSETVASTTGSDPGKGSGQRPTFSKVDDDGDKPQLAHGQRPPGTGSNDGNVGEDPSTAMATAQLAGNQATDPPKDTSGPTFTTLSGDTITTIGDAVVAASCPRCR